MFTLVEKRVVTWPVKVKIAKDGESTEQVFNATWNIPDIDTARRSIEYGGDISKLRDFLSEHLVGWSDIEDAEGNTVPYGAEAKAALLRWTDAFDALSISFAEAVRGGRR